MNKINILTAIFIISFLSLFPSKLFAQVVEVEDGYILTYSQGSYDETFKTEGNFDIGKAGNMTFPSTQNLDTSIRLFIEGFRFQGYFNQMNDNYDMGFVPSTKLNTYFNLTKYFKTNTTLNAKEFYIKSIEIKWSDKPGSHDPLWVHARKSNPYKVDIQDGSFLIPNLEDIESDTDEFVIFDRKEANDDLTQVHFFKKPVKYFILSCPDQSTTTTGENHIIRVEYFKVHFTYEDPTTALNETELVLGSGDDQINLPWSKEDIVLDNIVSTSDPETSLDNLELRFFLTPEFEPTEAPDVNASKPQDFDDTYWYLYQQFEGENRMNYDGYIGDRLSDNGKIKCSFDSSSGKLSLPIPCSGLYRLNVESETVNITANSLLLNVYPDITHSYDILVEDQEGMSYTSNFAFSLNQVTFPESLGTDKTLGYPYADKSDLGSGAFNAEAVSIFIPGLYDADIFYKLYFIDKTEADLPPQMGIKARKSIPDDLNSQGYELYSATTQPSFTELDENNIAVLQLKIAKNNAVTPDNKDTGNSIHTLALQLDTTVDTPTSVDCVSTESYPSEPQYFNLNGLRIDSRNLAPGIYIRAYGKSSPQKIVVR